MGSRVRRGVGKCAAVGVYPRFSASSIRLRHMTARGFISKICITRIRFLSSASASHTITDISASPDAMKSRLTFSSGAEKIERICAGQIDKLYFSSAAFHRAESEGYRLSRPTSCMAVHPRERVEYRAFSDVRFPHSATVMSDRTRRLPFSFSRLSPISVHSLSPTCGWRSRMKQSGMRSDRRAGLRKGRIFRSLRTVRVPEAVASAGFHRFP